MTTENERDKREPSRTEINLRLWAIEHERPFIVFGRKDEQ